MPFVCNAKVSTFKFALLNYLNTAIASVTETLNWNFYHTINIYYYYLISWQYSLFRCSNLMLWRLQCLVLLISKMSHIFQANGEEYCLTQKRNELVLSWARGIEVNYWERVITLLGSSSYLNWLQMRHFHWKSCKVLRWKPQQPNYESNENESWRLEF